MSLKRLDILIFERGLATSRERAQALILEGAVWSGTGRLDKPGTRVPDDLPLEIRSRQPRYVSRGGEKLEAALVSFGIGVSDRVCLDVGASTGGFTDCLLQAGASLVFAVDVGYGQLDYKLRRDPRVISIERCNARQLDAATLLERDERASRIDFACVDVSFISLDLILPAIRAAAPGVRDLVALFKPQFEVGPEHVGKGGLVKNDAAVAQALRAHELAAEAAGWRRRGGPEVSPLPGKKSGNLEYLIHYESK